MSNSKQVGFLRDRKKKIQFEAGDASAKKSIQEVYSDAAALSARLAHFKQIGFISPKQAQDIKKDQKKTLEAIIGVSNYLPAWFLEAGVSNSNAVCLIETSGTNFRGERGSWSGTGFLVSPNILITNNHVINSQSVAANATCRFNYQEEPGGAIRETRDFRLDPTRLFITSDAIDGLDFTFVYVEGNPGNDFGSVSLERSSFSIAVGERANVIAHPGGRLKTVTLQDNTIEWQDDVVIHYTSDTEYGSSGACVCNNEWKLVALHHAFKEKDEGEHPILNEGIKVSAISTFLENLVSSGVNVDQARHVLSLFEGSNESLGYFGATGRNRTASSDGLEAVVDTYKGTEDDIDVAFWNIEWFSNRFESKVDDVAKVIFDMNLDIWALEESSPDAAKALVKVLKDDYGLKFGVLHCEPNASTHKQSCTVIWNKKTVNITKEEWGEPIETWIDVHSRRFDELQFEAVEGKVFNRYPALFHCTALDRDEASPFDFYLIPLHLKAKSEGSKRREMASKILAAAVAKKIEEGADADFVIGGDFNAELASGDFDDLIEGDFVPVSASDEEDGAMTYIKRPFKSLIDHIFLSPNMAEQFGEEDFFIVAADRPDPRDFLRNVSDHRPVLMRLSLRNAQDSEPETAFEASGEQAAAIDELKRRLKAV